MSAVTKLLGADKAAPLRPDPAAFPLDDAVRGRRSIRAFLPDPVPAKDIAAILELAKCAPSGGNMQPWVLDLLTGQSLERYRSALLARAESGRDPDPGYPYVYPGLSDPYAARRRACGHGLYAALGVARDDKAGRQRAFLDNYRLFGAPVLLLLWFPRAVYPALLCDAGGFLQTAALAAVAYGYGSITQGALAAYPDIAAEITGRGDAADLLLIAGIAIGRPDLAAAVNGFQPAREPLDRLVTFHD